MKSNPFDRYELSPEATVDEITQELRDRAEDASDEEKKQLREAWEDLTMHPKNRVRAALLTFPERSSVSAKAPRSVLLESLLGKQATPSNPRAADLVPRPNIAAGLRGRMAPPPAALPPLEEDPLLASNGRGVS